MAFWPFIMAHPLIQKVQTAFAKVIAHLEEEYAHLQIGRASAGLVEHLMVEVYGVMQAVKSIASISVPDGRTVQIQPWDRSALAGIEKAIQSSDLNLNPVNNGVTIILSIPPLTEERRRDLVKVVGRAAEESKIALRNIRHDLMTRFKNSEHEGEMTEDERKGAEKDLQNAMDEANKKVDEMAKKKEEAIMTL